MTKSERAGDGLRAMAEGVARTLRERIIRGELMPDQRIVERALSAELGVSRTPVREALKLLCADGLVELSRNRGARVTVYRGAEAIDLFEVIGALEAAAAARVTRTLDPARLARLERLHERMLRWRERRDIDRYFDANSAIHDAIIEMAGNAELIDSHRRLTARARRGRYMAIMDERRWTQAVEEHERLMRALRDRDVRLASDTWATHLRHTGESVAAALGTAERAPSSLPARRLRRASAA